MATRRSGHDGNGNGNGQGNGKGNGEFVTWLQLNFAELKAITKELQANVVELRANVVELRVMNERMDHRIVLQTREVEESKRQTREIIREIARIEAGAGRHELALARELAKIGKRVIRLEGGARG
ncbi:MAG: hypothetical protein HYZ53_04105 [Planctomycetes bacterium]|nr:hypothetical protein [Planctomycetota bacterium]